jgi:hypothetical protein
VRRIVFPVVLLIAGVLPACSGENAVRTATPEPSSSVVSPVTATPPPIVTATPPAWVCFGVGIYEHVLCRLPNGALVLDSLGEVLATSEKAYPHCPDGWLTIDAGHLCLPSEGWSLHAESPNTATSAAGARVSMGPGDERPFPCADTGEPVYVVGLVPGPQARMSWCLRVGQRWATIVVPAEASADEYYAAFQVALSGVAAAPTP